MTQAARTLGDRLRLKGWVAALAWGDDGAGCRLRVRELAVPGADGAAFPRLGYGYSTTATGWSGGVRLPQKAVSSTFSGVIAAPGILRFGPQSSMVSSDSSPTTS